MEDLQEDLANREIQSAAEMNEAKNRIQELSESLQQSEDQRETHGQTLEKNRDLITLLKNEIAKHADKAKNNSKEASQIQLELEAKEEAL